MTISKIGVLFESLLSHAEVATEVLDLLFEKNYSRFVEDDGTETHRNQTEVI